MNRIVILIVITNLLSGFSLNQTMPTILQTIWFMLLILFEHHLLKAVLMQFTDGLAGALPSTSSVADPYSTFRFECNCTWFPVLGACCSNYHILYQVYLSIHQASLTPFALHLVHVSGLLLTWVDHLYLLWCLQFTSSILHFYHFVHFYLLICFILIIVYIPLNVPYVSQVIWLFILIRSFYSSFLHFTP